MLSIDRVTRDAFEVWRPPPELTVSEWADEHRRLSAESSAVPGRWRTDFAPYQRGILDAINDPAVHTVVVMSSAQVGKTEVLINIIGYFIHQDPSPILCLQPTLDMAEAFSKDRLAPMVRDTPALRDKIADPRSRDSGNTLLHKKFPGGHITMAGANSPASLASRPIRVVLCDEVDRYPPSAGSEGDPVELAKKRTATFWNRKVVLTSTPTIKDLSRIEQAYQESDQRTYHVTCPHCDHTDRLNWESVKWPDNRPQDAAIACKECGSIWTERERRAAVSCGVWVPNAEFTGVAGFHLSELYSPWSTIGAMASAFVVAKRSGTEQLKTWINTSLGEAWEEQGETVSEEMLFLRSEKINIVPADVAILTMGVDIQADRIELEVVGWGIGEESWSVDYIVLPGSTTEGEVWQDLADVLHTSYKHESKTSMRISSICIDNGYLTRRVNEFVRQMGLAYMYPTKGIAGPGRPIVESMLARARRLRKRKSKRISPELIGVDEAKLVLMRRLKQVHPGHGFCHFPDDRDKEYFRQLTAEKLVTKYKQGRPQYEWIKIRARNEALDCRILAHAALLLADPDWTRLTAEKVKSEASPKKEEKPAPRRNVHRLPMRPRR